MTKAIHSINADSTRYKVRISVQERMYNHEEQRPMDVWNTVETYTLDTPGQLRTHTIWDSRRIIIEEIGTL